MLHRQALQQLNPLSTSPLTGQAACGSIQASRFKRRSDGNTWMLQTEAHGSFAQSCLHTASPPQQSLAKHAATRAAQATLTEGTPSGHPRTAWQLLWRWQRAASDVTRVCTYQDGVQCSCSGAQKVEQPAQKQSTCEHLASSRDRVLRQASWPSTLCMKDH